MILALWAALFLHLRELSNIITYKFLYLPQNKHYSDSIHFFLYEVPKIFLLLVLIIFIIGFLRSFFPPEKARKLLEGKSLLTGNIMASILGIVTPFCSCSAIPLFIGFVESGIPLGVTFSFLIAAPLINEIAIVLLIGLFGWKVTALYIGTGLVIAIASGWVIEKIRPEKFIEQWVLEVRSNQSYVPEKLTFEQRVNAGTAAVKDIISRIWLYIIIGIGIGAAAHGYVPENLLAGIMGKDAWFSVPLSILVGIPLYSNAAGIIPIISVLIEKGASLGTALAFMMSVIGLSLPEIVILKKVLKFRLLVIFILIVALGILTVGVTFNLVL